MGGSAIILTFLDLSQDFYHIISFLTDFGGWEQEALGYK